MIGIKYFFMSNAFLLFGLGLILRGKAVAWQCGKGSSSAIMPFLILSCSISPQMKRAGI